ncbi:PucR family transcriptional regulator, partial [Streptomyces sp. O3]
RQAVGSPEEPARGAGPAASAEARAGGRVGGRGVSAAGGVPVAPGGKASGGAAKGAADARGGDPLDGLTDVVESAAARSGEPLLVVPDGGERLVLLIADGGAAADACVRYAETLEAARTTARAPEEGELVVGLSAPAGPVAAATAYKQAEQALSVARRRGRALVEHEELAAGSVLPLLADDAVRAFADGLLRALREHDATGRGDLVESLRAWLSRHGQWDAAAAELGVHRHTLRYRMRRVEEILGRSLDDPDARMELWLALKTTAAASDQTPEPALGHGLEQGPGQGPAPE